MLEYLQIGSVNKNHGVIQCNTPTRGDASGWMNSFSVLEGMMVHVVIVVSKNMNPKLAKEARGEKEVPNCITLPMKTSFDLGKAYESNMLPIETISHMGITRCVEVNLILP
jgi:hypothetical protein